MRWRRLVVAGVLLVLGIFAVMLAADLRSWRSAISTGDTRFAQLPQSAFWQASTFLPGDPALHILGLQDELAFRHAAKRFQKVSTAGNGVDNGYTQSQARGVLENQLEALTSSPNKLQASEASNLLGILSFLDTRASGPAAPAPVERTVADFQAAVQLDPTNENAKFNLELLLHDLLAKGIRPGSNASNGGPGKGHKGAAGGTPGRGY